MKLSPTDSAREKAWRELNINQWRLKLRSTTDQKKAAELLDAMYDEGYATRMREIPHEIVKCRRCGAEREGGKFEICCM